MRVCPTCGNSFPDDANFCPMDASKLPPPAAAAPQATAGPVATSHSDAATVMDGGAMAIGGRFLVHGQGKATPTGQLYEAHDTQANGTQVWVKIVSPEALPNSNMADRALRELKQLAKVSSDRLLKVLDEVKGSDGKV